jgi:hypothetical protein
MLTGELVSAGLRRTDKSVLNHGEVKIDTNDDPARVYLNRISEDGSGEVERRENAIAQQKKRVQRLQYRCIPRQCRPWGYSLPRT